MVVGLILSLKSFPEMDGFMVFKSNPKIIFQNSVQIRKPNLA